MGTESKRRVARMKRKLRVRKKIFGTSERPRLSVFRSSKHIYAQLIDDTSGKTIVASSSLEKAFKEIGKPESKRAAANSVGKMIGERAKDKGINEIIFDRNGYIYHGRVKALSEGAREAGLVF
jgi:large subunit ribosomal protein L18